MKILILEGSPQDGYRIEDFLWDSGFPETCNFRHANKIAKAIELTQAHHFHLIIIDPSFSKESGLALIKTVKDFSPSTVVIAFSLCSTTFCTTTCREQCSDQGADCYLDKNTQFDQLPVMIRKHLNPTLLAPDKSITTLPKRTLPSILRSTFNDRPSLRTPSFLRSRRTTYAS